MRKEFSLMKNLRFDVSFMCPVSCTGGSLKYFRPHRTGDCKQEDCLHYWTESEICSAKRTVRCRRCPTALNKKVQVETFSPWLSPNESQVTIFFHRNITFFSAFVLYMNFEFNFFIFLRRHNLYHALTYDSLY